MVELIPDFYVARLDLWKIFGRLAPLQVDLGCGDGSFLFSLAEQLPEKNFLGIERLVGRVRNATHRAARVDNMRILRVEASYAVRYLLPKQSVDVFHLLFPDPWPKRRHHRRRTVTEDFLSAISAALVENGTLRIATDQADYFNRIWQVARQSSSFSVKETNGDGFPASTFEKKFKDQGTRIYRLELRKISRVT